MTHGSDDDVSVDDRGVDDPAGAYQSGDAHVVFAGLAPTRRVSTPSSAELATGRQRHSRAVYHTVPILLASSVAMYLNATGPIETAAAQPLRDSPTTGLPKATIVRKAVVRTTSLATPASYRVVVGDNVSKIAARFGLSVAAVLAQNGLSAKSLIFPGQLLRLTSSPVVAASVQPTEHVSAGRYTIVKGDTISKIAAHFGVSTNAVLSANRIVASSIIYPGQSIVIPGVVKTATIDPVPVAYTSPIATPGAPPSATANGLYVILPGDSISKISKKFGISVQSILAANALGPSSLIYSGHTLIIPGVATQASGLVNVTLLNNDMEANARVIVAVGRQLGVGDYGIVIALSAAMQESGLLNINYGHLDSVGLFQQRPSAGWGTIAELTNPTYSARLFYGGPSNPNRGITRGLLDITGWKSMTVTQAAQKVQVSAYPNAYAKWESSARFWLAALN
jgi:N-acetylmuramoyl-L-alanine amidase